MRTILVCALLTALLLSLAMPLAAKQEARPVEDPAAALDTRIDDVGFVQRLETTLVLWYLVFMAPLCCR